MKYLLLTTLALLCPIFTQTAEMPNRENCFFPVKDQNSHLPAIDLWFAAKTVYSEARGESEEGKRYACETIRQRSVKYGLNLSRSCFKGFDGARERSFTKTPDSALISLCKDVLQGSPIHNYTYFINFDKVKDTKWKRYSLGRRGRTIGNHFFYGKQAEIINVEFYQRTCAGSTVNILTKIEVFDNKIVKFEGVLTDTFVIKNVFKTHSISFETNVGDFLFSKDVAGKIDSVWFDGCVYKTAEK